MAQDVLRYRLPKVVRRKQPLLRAVPVHRRDKSIYLSQQSRVNGTFCLAPRGHGKSRYLGRNICYQDAVNHIGTVCIDVVGGTINNALDTLLYLPKELQLEVGDRLRYCNMSGEQIGDTVYVTPWPLFGHYGGSPLRLFHTGKKPVELVKRIDRQLATASIHGLNRLSPLLTSLALVLTSLGEPLHRFYDLLDQPEDWKDQLINLAFANPQAREACLFLLAFFDLPAKVQAERTEVIRSKFFDLKLDPVTQAMFGAQEPLIDFDEVSAKGLQVYCDFSGNEPDSVKEMKIMHIWESLLEYVKSRGSRGHEYPPLSVVIDELSYFVRGTNLATDVITEEFREFIEVRSRNANCCLTAATQSLTALPDAMQDAVLSLGNLLIGPVLDYNTRIALAKRLYPKDPKLVKDWHYKYAIEHHPRMGTISSVVPIDRDAVYYPLDEQDYLHAELFSARNLGKGEFLLAATNGEGQQATTVQKIGTAHIDQGRYDSHNSDKIAALKQYLMQRDGIPVSVALAALDRTAVPAAPIQTDGATVREPTDENGHQHQEPAPYTRDTYEAAQGQVPVPNGHQHPHGGGSRFGHLPLDEIL